MAKSKKSSLPDLDKLNGKWVIIFIGTHSCSVEVDTVTILIGYYEALLLRLYKIRIFFSLSIYILYRIRLYSGNRGGSMVCGKGG